MLYIGQYITILILSDILLHISFNISSLVDTIKIHGRTHVTAIELDNEIFGNPDEICATCTIDLNIGENVERIRYRSG